MTPNAIKLLETLREAPAAMIVSRDRSLQLFSGGSEPTPIEKCGQSQGTEIPAECKFFITTEGSVYYGHCPDGKICIVVVPIFGFVSPFR
jgi:hypothetical protein